MESCTENITGLNLIPKTRASNLLGAVGKRSIRAEAISARNGGVYRSENVGMSNRKLREIRNHRKSKVSWATDVVPGLVGPKARLKGVVDGQLVNIPALLLSHR